ncbi:hypothetical protein D3C71_1260080 [compost metagenome]
MLRAIDRLAGVIDEVPHVGGFIGGVAKDPHVGAGVAVQVVVVQVIAGAEEIATGDLMGIHLVFLEGGELGLGIADAVFQRLALFGGEGLEVERLAGNDADGGETRQQVFLGVLCRGKGEHEVQVAEQFRAVGHAGGRFRPADLRRGGRCRLLEVLAQGLDLVAALDFPDLFQVLFIEQLCAVQRIGDVALAAYHAVDIDWLLTFPVRADDHEVAATVAGAAGAQVGEILGVEVDQLDRVVTLLGDLWQGQDQRFGAQVHPHERVGGVRVRRDDRRVLGGEHPGGIADAVERCLEVRPTLVHGLCV